MGGAAEKRTTPSPHPTSALGRADYFHIGYVWLMAACGEKAVLVVTTSAEGTATNVARHRYELTCSLEQGHGGAHRDTVRNEEWEAPPGHLKMLLRDENE
ncbi:MAG: hypothetical protein ACOY0T_11570 [Myxococcota bacterium]